ncbi:LuxR family transcriptional regulator [Nocardioides sp. BP30]|uniref:LuxR family transcriptional regulator n=1 Tax=Nocardioides sp. BP30 TaxID=3036374 RepID=UPI002469A4F6|nr:LuxR family transcriptional regulator [Nocardioides sp. BP30]WGL52419.1 LuxR family transcriptional regulator [Nocardioides sp. BP30]
MDDSAVDRALLEGRGTELFEAAVAEGGIPVDDPRIVEGGEFHEAFSLLVSLGLLHHDGDDGTLWVPDDPGTAQGRVVAPLSLEGTRLLQESTQWARDFAALGQIWRRGPQAASGPFTYLRGDAIAPYISALAAEATEEILTAQPQTGRDLGVAALKQSLAHEQELVDRGVRVLTLYQHAARRNTSTQRYVAGLTELGAEVRTLDEFFHRLIVVDRRVALIPTEDDLGVALAVREPTVVAYLVDVFLRSWERARPFTSSGEDVTRHIAGEQRAMTIRMLIEGYADPGAAKRLGVSSRTYAAYVADLKTEFDADTRFQLGYILGRQGIIGEPQEIASSPETHEGQ